MPKHTFSVMKHARFIIIKYATKIVTNVKGSCFFFENFLLLRQLFVEKQQNFITKSFIHFKIFSIMKKFLLSATLLLMGAVATFAQEIPDGSGWQPGDDITDQLSWGNLSFTADPMTDWTLKPGSGTTTGGAFEAYDNAEADLYQYIWLPAGMYKMTCQGYYRGGSSGPDDETTVKSGQCPYNWLSYLNDPKDNSWEDNAFIFATRGSMVDDVFTADHQFKSPLMPRLYENQQDQIFSEGDTHPDGWNKSDYYYPELGCWGPTSFPGSKAWFDAGKYKPIDGVKYNTVSFFLTAPGCVKVGITKAKKINQDTFFCTDFKMYYIGEPDEVADLLLAQEDVQNLLTQLEDMRDLSTGLMNGKLDEDLMLYTDEFGSDPADLTTLQDLNDAKSALTEILDSANIAKIDAATLETAIASIESLLSSTDNPGKADIAKILDRAKEVVAPEYIYEGEFWNTFKELTAQLNSARLDYLMSSPMGEDGSYNFSTFITTPFFCDTEYTPVWNEEANAFVFPTIDGIDEGLQPDNTWATIQEQGYSDAKKEEARSEWIPICENVTINSNYVENQWVIKSTTWHGEGGVGVTMQHSYPAIGGWTASPSGNPELLYQTITGLPNGFYSMSALMCNAGADISELQYVYIENGETKSIAPLTKKGDPWWGGNKEAWRAGVWEMLKTDMIYVDNGTVTIGSSSDAFYATTGFQLYYYGETPDYDGMLAKNINAAKADVELLWNGDQAKVNEMLNEIPAHITDKEMYLAAQEALKKATDYINAAKAATTSWKGLENFSALANAQEEGSAEQEIANFAMLETLNIGDEAEGTWYYTDAINNDNQYKAYTSYLNYRASLGEFMKDPLMTPVVSEQNEYLKANFATPEKLDEFKNALGAIYNQAKFIAEGVDKATLENPIDVSFLIINPSFLEGINKGWTVEKTDGTYTNDQYGYEMVEGKPVRTIAEVWGAAEPFSISQTLNGLPAGTYEIRSHAMYRDGWSAGSDGLKQYLEDVEAGGEENWRHNEATFYAEGKNGQYRQETPVKSIYSIRLEEPSFTYYAEDSWYEYDETDGVSYMNKMEYLTDYADRIPKELNSEIYEGNGKELNTVPFDNQVTVTISKLNEAQDGYEDVTYSYFFPQRTIGVVKAVELDYNNFLNKLYINLPEGGSLTFGIDKTKSGGGCSITMDDFEIFYCGKEIPTAIDAITEAGETVEGAGVEYYSINGVQLSAPQKGFNIVKYADGTTRKIYIQ